MDPLKPILKNTEEQPMATDMDHVVTIYMVHDPEMLKNELEEDECPPTFEGQTSDPLITGNEPAMCQFFVP